MVGSGPDDHAMVRGQEAVIDEGRDVTAELSGDGWEETACGPGGDKGCDADGLVWVLEDHIGGASDGFSGEEEGVGRGPDGGCLPDVMGEEGNDGGAVRFVARVLWSPGAEVRARRIVGVAEGVGECVANFRDARGYGVEGVSGVGDRFKGGGDGEVGCC